MSENDENQTTSNDSRVETAMEVLRDRNPELLLYTFCLGDCTNDPQNDTHLSGAKEYQLLFFVCHKCPKRGKEIEVAATLLENWKEKPGYRLCQKIFMFSAHESELLDWTELLRWILDPSVPGSQDLQTKTEADAQIKVCTLQLLQGPLVI